MDGFPQLGKILVITGIIIAVIGLGLMFFSKIPFFGKMPGDFIIKRDNFTVYIPIMTSIIISIILSLIFYFISRMKR